jgi:AcrR family transcriptional regulator
MTATHPSQEPRWRRLPEERPKQILDAAHQVFAERGLACARLDDIAKRAGLSKGTIYLYFPNKEELFREVIRQTVISQLERGERDLDVSTQSAAEDLTSFMRGYWEFLRSPEFAPIYRLVTAELHDFPDLAQFYAAEVIARGLRLIGRILERGIASGEFVAMDATVGARMLAAPLMLHAFWCNRRDCFPLLADRTDAQVLDEIVHFYLNAIRPRQMTAATDATQ